MKERNILLLLVCGFLGACFLPVESLRFQGALLESLRLLKWYAQEHVLLCLVPAFSSQARSAFLSARTR